MQSSQAIETAISNVTLLNYDLIRSHLDRMIKRAEERGEMEFMWELRDAKLEFYRHEVDARNAFYDALVKG